MGRVLKDRKRALVGLFAELLVGLLVEELLELVLGLDLDLAEPA